MLIKWTEQQNVFFDYYEIKIMARAAIGLSE